MRNLLSIQVALVLAAAIHVDWHLARPHDHGGLSGGWPYHWLFALPVFALAAWYLARRSTRPIAAGAVSITAAVLLGQGFEPLGETLLFGDPLSETFSPHRLGAFAAFMAAGIVTYGVVTWWQSRRPTTIPR